MKKTFLALLLLVFCVGLRADLLDDVARQLDLMEKEYWRSQYSDTGEYREGVEKRLRAMVANIHRISNQLRRIRQHRIADISSPAVTLLSNYGKVRPSTIKRFSLVFEGTAMRDYTKEYRLYVKEKEEQKAAGENADEGKKGRKSRRSRSRSRRIMPTLANVDLIEYERWLAEIVAHNMDKFINKRNNGSDSERDKMNDQVSVYLTSVKNIRLGLVKIRQQTKVQFK